MPLPLDTAPERGSELVQDHTKFAAKLRQTVGLLAPGSSTPSSIPVVFTLSWTINGPTWAPEFMNSWASQGDKR